MGFVLILFDLWYIILYLAITLFKKYIYVYN